MEPGRLPPALIAALGLAHACDLGPCLTSSGCSTAGTCDTTTDTGTDTAVGPCLTSTPPPTDTAESGDTGATSSPAPSTQDVRIEVLGSDRLPSDVVRRLSTDR